MRRMTVAAVVLAIAGGCNLPSVPDSKEESYQRWYRTRAKVLCGVGTDLIKSGQLDRARNKGEEALSLDAECLDARLLLGKVYIEQGHYAAAATELRTVVAKRPGMAQPVYLLGVALEHDRRLEEALVCYQKALALDTRQLSAVVAACEVLVALGKVDQAAEHIERYILDAGENVEMYETAGRLALMQERYDQAARYLEQACDLDPKNLQYRLLLVRAQSRCGRHAEVRANLTRVIAAKSKDYTPPAWVHSMLGDSCVALGRLADARSAYYTASDCAPDHPGVWVNLGKVSLAMGDADRAILSARRALSLAQGDLEATLILGYALVRSGRANQAVAVLTEASRKHPKSAIVQCLLGRAHASMGRQADAKRCYALAACLEPKNKLAETLSGR